MQLPDVCEKCGLYKGCHTYKIPGAGASEPDIIFIGEAPGAEEDEQGIPFVGKSGKLLRGTVEGLGLERVRYTNIVRCRPPDNRTPKPDEIDNCMPYLAEELDNHPAKVVVLLGNTPLKAVLGLNGISSYQGQIIERKGVTYIPSFHPSYVVRGGVAAMDDWYNAFEVIVKVMSNLGKERLAADAHYTYKYPLSLPELRQMRDELLAQPDELIPADIETMTLRVDYPNKKAIVSIAFADAKTAWSFPVDHPEWDWGDERGEVLEIIADVLTHCKIINHNIKFDCKMIRHYWGIDFVPVGDTIQLSRLVTPQALEHGLKRLAGVHLQMFDYDQELRDYIAEHPECDYDKGGNYGNVPLDILLPYGGLDVAATKLLHDVLYPQLTDKQKILYDQMLIKADYALGVIEENGFKLDYWLINRYMNIYRAIMSYKYEPAMLQDKHVQQFIEAQLLYLSLEQSKMLTKHKEGKRYVCELTWPDGTVWRFDKADWHHHYIQHRNELMNLQLPELKRKPKFEFNPGSHDQVAPILFEYKGMKPEGVTDSGQPSIKRDLLKKVIFNLKQSGKTVDQFLLDYMDWKLLSSIMSKTFGAASERGGDWYSNDSRVRSTYTIGGAKTGRTSSARPNLQNIPAIEKEPGTVLAQLPAKNIFTHTFPGGGLAMLDYSGMELRVICSIANIQGMIDVFNRKGDVHRYVSSFIYKKPEDQITKDERYRGKWSNWSLLYKGGWMTLYRLYSALGLTEQEAQFIAQMYYNLFPELPEYHKRIERFVMANGYAESVFGRRLPLPNVFSSKEYEREEALRTAVNFPIQGLASDVLMVALAIITQLMRSGGYQSMFVNTVHDSLVIDYHPDEKEDIVRLATDVMENVVDYAAEWMPGLDFSWLRVPLKADAEYGTHYGSYGFLEPLLCETCNNPLIFSQDTGEKDSKQCVAVYSCPTCDVDVVKSVKPIVYNNTSSEALRLQREWQQVLSRNSYQGARVPRKV